MRPLTETETQTLFRKLADYTGPSLKNLIAPLDDSPDADRYVFRLGHGQRVYYVRLSLANLATSVARDKLLSLGVSLGMWRLFPVPSLFRPLRHFSAYSPPNPYTNNCYKPMELTHRR